MILLLDIGNTHTHLGLAGPRGIFKRAELPSRAWAEGGAGRALRRFAGDRQLSGAACCSVVPAATPRARQEAARLAGPRWFELTAKTCGSLVDPAYPRPATIGPDRLANAIAAREHYGAPCLAVDFGTAVTFDVVDKAGRFVGGVIAPGVALMTEYLHQKTALLPKVSLRSTPRVIGRSTEAAMQSAAYHGFRGMVRELVRSLRREVGRTRLPVVATGGYARRIAADLSEITAVEPNLTLEGLRLAWLAQDLSPAPPR
jgi:type III pantothenate kinase